MINRLWALLPVIVLTAVFGAAAALLVWRGQGAGVVEPDVNSLLPEPCYEQIFEGDSIVVCPVDPARYRIALGLRDGTGKAYGNLSAYPHSPDLAFSMNAGMYHEDKSPVGLYVENGKELSALNTDAAAGNFFMKPNGVFFVDDSGKVGVLETVRYASMPPVAVFATQSGPMLVIDGQIHPRFEPDGSSRHIRNGVGIDGSGRAVFAISRGPVSLGKFARLFRDGLGCSNALFFDGAISALHDGKDYLIGGGYPAGPIVAVFRREDPPS